MLERNCTRRSIHLAYCICNKSSMRTLHITVTAANARPPSSVPPPQLPLVPSRRNALLAATAAALVPLAPANQAQAAAFCGVLDGAVPGWAFSSPWEEERIPGPSGEAIWTRRVGQRGAASPAPPSFRLPFGSAQTPAAPAKRYPILVIPSIGVPARYLEPLELLGEDREIIFYDTYGCGRSRGRIEDLSAGKGKAKGKPASSPAAEPAATTAGDSSGLEYRIAELGAVRAALGLTGPIHVVAEGTGAAVALEALSRGQLPGVASLTLVGAADSADSLAADRRARLASLPADVAAVLGRASTDAAAPEYAPAAAAYRTAFVSGKVPFASCVAASLRGEPAGAFLGAEYFSLAKELGPWRLDLSSLPAAAAPAKVLVANGTEGEVSRASSERLMRALEAAFGAQGVSSLALRGAGSLVVVDGFRELLEAVEATVQAADALRQ